MTKHKYTAADIQTHKGLEAIRNRPTEYINGRGSEGQTHTIREYCDNSNDELALFDTGVLEVLLFRDRVHGRYQIMITDTGRGIPLDAFVDCLTERNTSGKFSSSGAYWSSGGLFGVGAKVATALSTRYKAITRRQEGIGVLCAKEGVVTETVFDRTPRPTGDTGTVVVFEPDVKIFQEVQEYMESGYLDLITRLRTWNVFNNIQYVFKISDYPLPEAYWNADIQTTLEYIQKFTDLQESNYNLEITYNSENDDASQAMLAIFQVNSPVVWSLELIKPRAEDDRLAYRTKILMTRKPGSGLLHLLNNIPIPNANSDHVAVFYQTLAKQVLPYIEREDLRNFFISSGYQIPMYVALNVKYHQAELSGTTKDKFQDKVFAKQYAEDLTASMNHYDAHFWKSMVGSFIDDLEDKFNIFYNRKRSVKDPGLMTMNLNFPDSFKTCDTFGPHAELFIVEGESAGGIAANRNTSYQAVMAMRGKPTNATLTAAQSRKSIEILEKDPLYADLIQILGIIPGSRDLSRLRFGKIIFTSDADPDGDHICCINLGDLYNLCPALIEGGYVWIATPPLYSLTFGRKSTKYYLRDKLALFDTRIDLAYRTTMDITIESDGVAPKRLEGEAYREFCHIVLHLGEKMANSARVLNHLPLLILERLALGLQYLTPQVNIDALKNHFGEGLANQNVRLTYYPDEEVIVLTLDETDYPIALRELANEIRQNLLPDLIRIRANDWLPRVASKINPEFNHTCTLMQVYLLFNSLNEQFHIRRYKGLGELSKDDVLATIINPETRSLFHITEVGDIHTLYRLLGPDSIYRKQMLDGDGMLSDSMKPDTQGYF